MVVGAAKWPETVEDSRRRKLKLKVNKTRPLFLSRVRLFGLFDEKLSNSLFCPLEMLVGLITSQSKFIDPSTKLDWTFYGT